MPRLRYLAYFLLCVVGSAAQALAGVTFHSYTGRTLYVRVQTGASTFKGVALTEGSSGGLGVYAVTDAALVSAGLTSTDGDYAYTIRTGSASDTANDTIVGTGVLGWAGTAERPLRSNVTQYGGRAGTFVSGLPTVSSQASPCTIYVNPGGGNNSNSGLTRAAALLNLSNAVSAANAGDTIRMIGSETLSGALTINKSVTIEGDNWSCGVTGALAAGNALLNLTADSITLRNLRVNETNLGVGILSNGVNTLTLDRVYCTGGSDGLFTNLLTVGYALDIVRCRFTSTWDGAVLGRWQMARVRDSYFYSDGTYANSGQPLTSYHACTGGAGGSTLMNIALDGNTFTCDVTSGSNVNDATTVSCLTLGERTLAAGDANSFVATAAKTNWAGTIAGVDAVADDTNGTPTIALDKYRIRVTSTTGTPAKYDVWSRNLTTPASTAKGIIELGLGNTTDGTTAQFSETTGRYIRSLLRPTKPLAQLDVSDTGEAGIDLNNLKQATGSTTLTNITVPTVTTLTNGVTVASGGITSGSFAANSITASAVASDAATEIGAAAGGATVSPYLVDKDHSWSFDSANQVTAPNTITEIIGFSGLLQMDFTQPLPALGSIASITTTSIADVGGATEPTISSSAVSADKKKVVLTIDATSATAATFTVSVKILTTDSQTIVRKGRLTIQ